MASGLASSLKGLVAKPALAHEGAGMRRGWFRLWVVVSVFAVPAGAVWITSFDRQAWQQQFELHWKLCDQIHADLHQSMEQCIHEYGADKDIYQQANTTAPRYWGIALGASLVLDLLLTGLLVGAFYVVRWVARGFRDDKPTSA